MNAYQVVIKPVDTEKTRHQADSMGKYVFEVDRRANKVQVKHAIESIYGVQVETVNVMVVPAKGSTRRGRRRIVRRPSWKKAVVTLAKGQQLNPFEGA